MNDLLTALLNNPHDPDLRIAYAGAVEDGKCELPAVDLRGGEVEYDQYGVPLLVKATMATWCGEECNNCNGSGEVYVWTGDIITPMDCRRCKGTGRIPGIAAAVCGAWPICQVELTDVTINSNVGSPTIWAQSESQMDGQDLSRGYIPDDLFDMIKGGKNRGNRFKYMEFCSESDALAALAHAALTLGRRAAGLETAKSNRVKDWLIFPAELTEEQIQRVEQYFDGI